MTEKDKGLIKMANSCSEFNHEFIASLIPKAETDEARQILTDLERDAFIKSEQAYMDTM